MTATRAFAAQSGDTPLAEISIDRREPGPKDVAIDILYCGVCHSDLHTARGEWGGVRFPSVPGHEIVGRVTAVGGEVTKVATGDLVGLEIGDLLSLQHDAPGGRLQEATQEVKQGRLSRPVRTNQRVDRSGLYGKVNLVNCSEAVELFG